METFLTVLYNWSTFERWLAIELSIPFVAYEFGVKNVNAEYKFSSFWTLALDFFLFTMKNRK